MQARSTLLIAALLLTALTVPALAQDGADPPPAALAIESLAVTPEKLAADTLCQLRVQLASKADQHISALAFEVEIGDAKLPVYARQLFMDNVTPGATTEVQLYNFWTTETDRPAPKSGKLRLVVTLTEARWLTLGTDDDGTEVWTLGEDVPGLPVKAELVLDLRKGDAAPQTKTSSAENGGQDD